MNWKITINIISVIFTKYKKICPVMNETYCSLNKAKYDQQKLYKYHDIQGDMTNPKTLYRNLVAIPSATKHRRCVIQQTNKKEEN